LGSAGALLVTLLGGLVVARRVLRPIEQMTDEAAALTPQDTTRRLRPESVVRELGSLSVTLNSALDRLGDALDRLGDALDRQRRRAGRPRRDGHRSGHPRR